MRKSYLIALVFLITLFGSLVLYRSGTEGIAEYWHGTANEEASLVGLTSVGYFWQSGDGSSWLFNTNYDGKFSATYTP
jgi:hypothetical protein